MLLDFRLDIKKSSNNNNTMNLKCTVGSVNGESCHLTTYCTSSGLISIESLDVETREIILWRSGLSMLNNDASICHHHKYLLCKRFPMQQKTCCNPFALHSSVRKGNNFSTNSNLYCKAISS